MRHCLLTAATSSRHGIAQARQGANGKDVRLGGGASMKIFLFQQGG